MGKFFYNAISGAVEDGNGAALVIALVLLLIILLFLSPVITIIAVNFIFGTQIPINLLTWLATLWLMIVFGGGSSSKSN